MRPDRGEPSKPVEQKNVDGTIVSGTKRPGDTGREVPLTRAALAALDVLPPRLDTTLLFAAVKRQFVAIATSQAHRSTPRSA